MDDALTPEIQSAIAGVLSRLDEEALSALAPGVGALLVSMNDPAAQLAEIRRQKLQAERLGDRRQAEVLRQIERDLERVVYGSDTRRTTAWAGVIVVLAIVVLGLIAVAVARARRL